MLPINPRKRSANFSVYFVKHVGNAIGSLKATAALLLEQELVEQALIVQTELFFAASHQN